VSKVFDEIKSMIAVDFEQGHVGVGKCRPSDLSVDDTGRESDVPKTASGTFAT
jgi:hypothetical protein